MITYELRTRIGCMFVHITCIQQKPLSVAAEILHSRDVELRKKKSIIHGTEVCGERERERGTHTILTLLTRS